MKNVIILFSFIACSFVSVNSTAQKMHSNSGFSEQQQTKEQLYSEAELAQILAPIALYPDSLLTHILIASTYPIEIVEAHRWLKNNINLSPHESAKAVNSFNWDASVKALVPFENILSRLSEELTWTRQLGDAFLQDEARLLESIQVLRKQAELAGNLEKMKNMDVGYEKDNITIESVEKQIVYVPYYDSRMVYGTWYWSSYPPVYWRPRHSVYLSHHRPFYWHSGIHISFNYFFSAFHWHNRHVVVVNPHRSHYRYYKQRPRRLIANGGHAKRWMHKPAHRKGVAYKGKYTRQKYHNKRAQVNSSKKHLHRTLQKETKRHVRAGTHVKNHSLPKKSAPKKHATITKAQTKKVKSPKAYRSKVVKTKQRSSTRKQSHRSASVNHHSRKTNRKHN